MTRKQRILTTTAITAFALTAAVIAYDHAKGNTHFGSTQNDLMAQPANSSSALQSDTEPLALAVDVRASR